ncbi:hypothetical protein N665_0198s0199 [Sinapis alba]|nr:hypothetical protein N665_0198s0199 [Sinapis alba]
MASIEPEITSTANEDEDTGAIQEKRCHVIRFFIRIFCNWIWFIVGKGSSMNRNLLHLSYRLAQVALIVRLEEVAVTTGEEDEDAVLDLYLKDELFCIRFAFIERKCTYCKTFMENFTDIAESQQVGKESKEGDKVAGLLENLLVQDKKSEDEAKKKKEKTLQKRKWT